MLSRLLAAALLLLGSGAGAATLTITLKSGQVITYDMNDVRTVVYSDVAATPTPRPVPAPTTAQRPWAGSWRTTDATIGVITLAQQGNVVTGSYPWKEGRIRGTVSGNEFVGEWTQSNGKGGFRLTLAADGKTLRGAWNYASDGTGGWRNFTATRP